MPAIAGRSCGRVARKNGMLPGPSIMLAPKAAPTNRTGAIAGIHQAAMVVATRPIAADPYPAISTGRAPIIRTSRPQSATKNKVEVPSESVAAADDGDHPQATEKIGA